MKELPITFACGPYDRMEALRLGEIQPEGIELRYIAVQSPPEIFARMLKTRSFDVAEMSLAHYMIMRSRGDFPFIAIPVFPSRVFRHGFIFINKNSMFCYVALLLNPVSISQPPILLSLIKLATLA